MSDEEQKKVGAAPSPQEDAEIRFAFMQRYEMLKPLFSYAQGAGFEQDRNYQQFVEGLRDKLVDMSLKDAYMFLYFYQLLIISTETQAEWENANKVFALLSKFFGGYDRRESKTFQDLFKELDTRLESIEKSIKELPKDRTNEVVDAIKAVSGLISGNILPELAQLETFRIGTTARLDNWESIRLQLIRDYKPSFDKFVKLLGEIPDEWLELLKEAAKLISEAVSEEISLRIVGQSYSRWDSTSSYYPTVAFIFREITTGNRPRTSQIQIRWKKTSQEITDLEIENLRAKIVVALPVYYNHGTLRCNYVQTQKLWKTTIFAQEKSEAITVLNKLASFLDQEIDEQLFSYTEGQKRTTITRRTRPLAGITPEYINYQLNFPVELYRAVVLVNGLRVPVTLYQKTEIENAI